ncbi:MAG: L-threonylcarbamoyladenylate synthase [Hyphomicrobiales bacterium]
MTAILKASDLNTINKALAVFRAGGLVAIPTETVYGLAADATNGEAVARIYEAKGRPNFNPLIAHCSTVEMALRYGHFSAVAQKAADHFWPGPLTLVVPYREEGGISPLVRAGLDSIALRVPNGVSSPLISALNKPIAAPSANLSGRISPTTAHHVQSQLDGLIDLIIDGGPCDFGVESTIISFQEDQPILLRPGGVEIEMLEQVLGARVQSASADSPIVAPGQLASHYAPIGQLRLNATQVADEDGALNFGNSKLSARTCYSLSESGDLREAAARLFACLSVFDEKKARHIAVAPIPEVGLGIAINDRLRRAAAPRK